MAEKTKAHKQVTVTQRSGKSFTFSVYEVSLRLIPHDHLTEMSDAFCFYGKQIDKAGNICTHEVYGSAISYDSQRCPK